MRGRAEILSRPASAARSPMRSASALLRWLPWSRVGRAKSTWALTAAIASVTVAAYALSLHPLRPLPVPIALPWWVFALGFACAELFVVHVQTRRDANTFSFSLSEVPLVLGLHFLSPTELVLARLLGAGACLLLYRRLRPVKLAFNLANFALGTALAVLVFRGLLGAADPLGPLGWIATFAGVFAAELTGVAMVVLAIKLSGATPPLRQLFGVDTLASFANTCLALLGATVLWVRPEAAWLLVVLGAMLFVAYKTYGSMRQKHSSLAALYESSKAVQQSLTVETVTLMLLDQAREMFRTDIAQIVLYATDGAHATVTTVGPGENRETFRRVALDTTTGVWARVAAARRAIPLLAAVDDETLHSFVDPPRIKDGLVAPLQTGDLVIGTMLVANRLSDVSSFLPEDFTLFETLANHASVSVENGRLVDRLRRQAKENEYHALHDPLTGLPNRSLFHRRLAGALLGEEGAVKAAVMIMDLDRFKEVNDTLGHHRGDQLLRELAQRVRDRLDAGITIARLSGDEFAILVPGGDREAAEKVGECILDALRAPFFLEEMTLQLGGSIGIALAPEHGQDTDGLLQRADVAMYMAKEAQSGLQVYEPDRDEYSPARLALASELREGIAAQQLKVAYQPKADLRTGAIVGVEALVRWDHPKHGEMLPESFLPVAERNGLLRPLTLSVLEEAVRQCSDWWRSGLELAVSVNLSARNLLDLELCEDIGRMLERWELPRAALQLEITETTIMTDATRTEAALSTLHRMGIGLSVDDFGTGYSSLSYLRRLPVREIKIDRSFVIGMAANENDAVIVRSTVELGRNLGMTVVAEGVETRETWDRLAALGCDVAQGYFLSPPLPADQLPEYLAKIAFAPAA